MYQTNDIYLASFLESAGFFSRDIIIKHKPKKVATFSFDETTELKVAIMSYQKMEARVVPQAYAQALKNLKNKMYSKMEENV